MPKRITDSDAPAFGKRLVALLESGGHQRRGAGAYLAKRYKVATVTANAWLNGEYKPNTGTAKRIADDHGSSFEALYFGAEDTATEPAQVGIDMAARIDGIRTVQNAMARVLAGSIQAVGRDLVEELRSLPAHIRDHEYIQDVLVTLDAVLPPRARHAPKRPAQGSTGRKRP